MTFGAKLSTAAGVLRVEMGRKGVGVGRAREADARKASE